MKLTPKLWSGFAAVSTLVLAVFWTANCASQPGKSGGAAIERAKSMSREATPRGPRPDFGQWNVTESDRPDVWVAWHWDRDGQRFKATWPDGTVAEMTVVNLGTTEITLDRRDVAGPRTGLTARYVALLVPGIIGEPLHAHLQGSVTWTWQGRETTGTWRAVSPYGRHLSLKQP